MVGPFVAGLASDLLSPSAGFLLLSPLLLSAGFLLAFGVPETLPTAKAQAARRTEQPAGRRP
jgi:hypothetical protein